MNVDAYEWVALLAVPVGAAATLAALSIRNRLGYTHYRMLCPKTAYPYPPKTCTCRCKPCRSCKRT